MFYKKFLKFSFLIIFLLCIGAVNATDIGDNITEIDINENSFGDVYDGQIMGDDFLLVNPNIENISTNSEYCSLIILNDNYAIIEGFNNNFSSDLPSYYLNNYSSIKNQSNGNNCWAFAAISTLESNILKINQSLTYDFSENNMKNIMSNSSNYGRFNSSVNNGGFDLMAIGYLTSWLGPVLESEDPYNLTSTNIQLFNSTIHVQNVLFNKHNDTNSIKRAIFDYGAVSLSYVHNNEYFNNVFKSYYSPTNLSGNGHSISIVGWNDSFSRENFNNESPDNGAWICKNSWGNSSEDDGLIYISYYDYYLNYQRNLGTYTFILNDTNNYNRNYQYDSLASFLPYNFNNYWFRNNFTSEGNDLLTAVSTYFYDMNTTYFIEVLVNGESRLNQSGFMSNKGYYTILLDNQIPLNIGDNFTVSIRLSRNENLVRFGLCPDVNVMSIHHPEHISFYSYDGINWVDLTNHSNSFIRGVACIKAFTVHNPFNTTLFLNVVNTTSRLVPVNIGAYVVDSSNNPVSKGNVIFNIRDNIFIVPIVNGYANLDYSFNSAGNISIFAYFSDYDYISSNASEYIFVNKDDVNLSCYYSYDDLFNCTIVNILGSDNFNSSVNLFENNHTYRVSVVDGIGFIQLPGFLNLSSSYVEFNGDDNFNPDNTSEIIFKSYIPHDIYQTYDVELYYKNGTRFVVTLRNSSENIVGKIVVISINGVNYTRITNESGAVSIGVNLNPGIYNVTTSYVDENNHTVVIRNILTIYTTIISQDLVKIFRNASQFEATFLDGQGNPLQYTSVTFNINGVMYNRTTNNNGTAKLNINLAPGVYIITSTNPINDEKASNNIIVLSRFVGNCDLVKYYRNGSQYIVMVLDDVGNPVGAGESVTFNINGVFYNRQTNSSGYVKFSINLPPGDYIITAEYINCRISNSIKVLPILSASDLTKKYGTSKPFVATLVDGQGKPYPDQTVQFNINGVLYNRVTDSSGQAKLNINLMAGEYIITSSYNGCNIANKITITA